MVALKEMFKDDITDPSFIVRKQLEAALTKHPKVLGELVRKAISEAPVMEEKAEEAVEEVKEVVGL